MAEGGGVGEEQRSEDLALIRIGLDVALFVDGEIFGLGTGGSGDVAVDVRGARFIGQIAKAKAEFAVAAKPARVARACDDAFERGAFRDQEVVVVVEDRGG